MGQLQRQSACVVKVIKYASTLPETRDSSQKAQSTIGR